MRTDCSLMMRLESDTSYASPHEWGQWFAYLFLTSYLITSLIEKYRLLFIPNQPLLPLYQQALNRSSSTSQESDAPVGLSFPGNTALERLSRQPSDSGSQASSATPESLMPSDMYQQQSGADTGALRGGGGFRGRGRRGSGAPPWFAGGFPGRGRGRGGGAGGPSMPAEFGAPGSSPASATTRTLDRRPRALIIADVSPDSWNAILDSFLVSFLCS